MTAFLARLPTSSIVVLLVVLAAGVGGGYALAASKTKTITVCADKGTGILHLKTRGKCKRSQTRVTWNQQGPQGAQGPPGAQGSQGTAGAQGQQGPAGVQGPAAVNVWAEVANDGTVVAGDGLTVHLSSPGTYAVMVTDATCSRETNAPVVSISDSNPPAGQPAGAFPMAWIGGSGANQQFTVFTGVVAGGTFTATDHTFDIHDTCP